MAATRKPKRQTATRAKTKPVEEEIDELEEADVEEAEEAPPAKKKPAARPRKVAAKKKPVPVEDEEDEDEDDEDEAPAEKPKRKPPVRKAIEFGTPWLVEHIEEKTGKSYKAYDLRVLLRKMANNGELDREVGSDRGRYEFSGPSDPIVKAIVKKVKDGEVEKTKKASLDKLKDSASKKKAKAKRAKDEDVEDEEIEDDDVEELDDDEDDE